MKEPRYQLDSCHTDTPRETRTHKPQTGNQLAQIVIQLNSSNESHHLQVKDPLYFSLSLLTHTHAQNTEELNYIIFK